MSRRGYCAPQWLAPVQPAIDFAPRAQQRAPGRLSLLLCGASLALLAGPALAQEQAAVDEVVVTGSRITNSGFTTPTPVTVVSASTLQASAPSTVAAALNNLPSLYTSGGPQANGGSQTVSRNSLNLRGLGITRTLTLLDGRRFPATFTDNTVDTNLLPQGLISRVEVVTGGASAAYGSDAVAGVINFILDHDFEGFKGSAILGISKHGDGYEQHYNATFGRAFAGGRGHVLADFEYYSSEMIPGDARDYRREGASIITNPNAPNPPTVAQPSRVVADFVRVPSTFGGLITAATGGTAAAQAQLVGTEFLRGGIPDRFDFGTLSSASNQAGGDGVNTTVLQPINRALDRKTAFIRGSYEITPAINAFAEASYAVSEGLSTIKWYHLGANTLTIRPDNAFLPAATRNIMTTGGVTSFSLVRWDNEPNTYTVVSNYTTKVLAGLEGEFRGFKWTGFYQYGLNRQRSPNYNIYNVANYALAVDSVLSPGGAGLPAAGTPICRSTLTAPGNGCVAFNPFGEGSPSAAAFGFTHGTNWVATRVQDESAGFNASGEVFNLPAGPVSMAAGFDWRRVKDQVESNSFSPAGTSIYFTGGVFPWQGAYSIVEGFGEAEIPLLRDKPLVQMLNLNVAGRYAHYSTDVNATTWKVGLNWRVIDDLRLRGTRSHDVRAPNPGELFRLGQQQTGVLTDPFRNNTRTTGISFISRGNPDLKPEIADTLVLGFVYQPSWLRGFDFSVDWYDIKVKDSIANLSAQQYLDRCFLGDTGLCSGITRNAQGVIVGALTSNFNFTSARSQGIDFEASYRVPLQSMLPTMPGTLTVRALASVLSKLETQSPGNAPIDRAGDISSSSPRWRGLLTANYDAGRFRAFVQMRYLGSGKWDKAAGPTSTNFNAIPSYRIWSAQLSYDLTKWAELSFHVQNIFDKDPLFAPANGAYNVTTNSDLYDQIGRYTRVKLSIRR